MEFSTVAQADRYLFYRFDTMPASRSSEWQDNPNFSMEIWKPSPRAPWPRGIARDKKLHFLFRTLLHFSGIFRSRESGAILIYADTRVVHYSAFTPRYWRFPFLTMRDLQVGDTWTEPSFRGRGLAKQSLHRLLDLLSEPGRGIWYVVGDVNRASIKVAEDCSFHLAGIGTRVRRVKGFDYYKLTTAEPGRGAAIPTGG
ncbi:MAG TPA: GNAT family protein [Candidatus Binataceae bacterium]|jgi:RimJ/RimL family protein N-acetyltransferase|nr:GNAT family protein [Candidatus Binataceae bacterium]